MRGRCKIFGALVLAACLAVQLSCKGAGAESRKPLGLAVVGGLVFSQLLTLFVTPVIYTYSESLQKRLGVKRFEESD